MSTSKLQRKTSQKLSYHFGKYTIRENSRPEWCLSNEMERLELDFLLTELDVAIEVQGDQHFRYTPYFHATYDDFKAQLARDEAKKLRCNDYGITLIEVLDEDDLEDAIKQIKRIETATSIRPRDVTPDEWERRLTRINDELIYLFRRYQSMTQQSPGEFQSKAHGYHQKMVSWISVYGIEILNNAEQSIVESIFLHTRMCINKAKAARKRNRRQRTQRWAERKAGVE